MPQEKSVVLQAINKSTRSVINPERGEGSDVGEPMRTHEHTAGKEGPLHRVCLSAGSDVQEFSLGAFKVGNPHNSRLDPGLISLYVLQKSLSKE